MALDQSALLDLLAQLKLTAVSDRIRVTTELISFDVAASSPPGGDGPDATPHP